MKVTRIFVCLMGIQVVGANIQCHYCGENKLCPLPYNEKITERVFCAKSCMKFDGNSLVDDKRVLVRSCGDKDINQCDKNVTFLGARGTLCLCNGINCNSGISLTSNVAVMVLYISLIKCLTHVLLKRII